MALTDYTTDELKEELKRRKAEPDLGRCPTCRGKWPIYMGCSGSWAEEQLCSGCRRPVATCTCR